MIQNLNANGAQSVTSIRSLLARALRRIARYADNSASQPSSLPWKQLNFDLQTMALWDRVAPRTMTSIERIDALREAIEYISANSIHGDIVECGVWRGGSMMAIALTLKRLANERRLWLYDTFSGMTQPGPHDMDFQGRSATDLMASTDTETSWVWGKSTLSDVQAALVETGYSASQLEYVVGPVELTIPQRMPQKIALLRLDTDWYESTYHELRHLWPLLTQKGILIIDDYGDWAGAKKAVDQYFQELEIRPFLHRIDGTGRLVIKS